MHYIYEINPLWMNLIIWENFCFSTTNKQDSVLKYLHIGYTCKIIFFCF